MKSNELSIQLEEQRTFTLKAPNRTIEDLRLVDEWEGLMKLKHGASGLHLIVVLDENRIVSGSPALIDSLHETTYDLATVPTTVLPDGTIVTSFKVGRYLSGRDQDGNLLINEDATPWVSINYHDARKACEAAGLKLITELQWLAIAHDISRQDINWTGGKVGEGKLYQGLHKDSVNKAMPASFSSSDPEERRWHQLSNGERIYDFAGNAYSWAFDNLQGDDDGLIAKKFAKDSRSISNIPAKPEKKGVGWYPNAGTDWSGRALIRGGCWFSGSYAGVFSLFYVFPDRASGGVGFRCTK